MPDGLKFEICMQDSDHFCWQIQRLVVFSVFVIYCVELQSLMQNYDLAQGTAASINKNSHFLEFQVS